jgi:hypothetical protein
MTTQTSAAAPTRVVPIPVPALIGTLAFCIVTTLYASTVRTPISNRYIRGPLGWQTEIHWSEIVIFVLTQIIAVAVIFGIVVARARLEEPRITLRRALYLAGAGVLTVPVWQFGVLPILALGALYLVLDTRRRSNGLPWTGIAAALLGIVLLGLWAFGVVSG